MTVRELIDKLEDLVADGLLDTTEIRFVYQSNYPLQDDIAGVWVASDEPMCPNGSDHELVPLFRDGRAIEDGRHCVDCDVDLEADELETPDMDAAGIAYIVSGGQHYVMPYGPARAFAEVM